MFMPLVWLSRHVIDQRRHVRSLHLRRCTFTNTRIVVFCLNQQVVEREVPLRDELGRRLIDRNGLRREHDSCYNDSDYICQHYC